MTKFKVQSAKFRVQSTKIRVQKKDYAVAEQVAAKVFLLSLRAEGEAIASYIYQDKCRNLAAQYIKE